MRLILSIFVFIGCLNQAVAQEATVVKFALTPETKALIRSNDFDVIGFDFRKKEIEALLKHEELQRLSSLKANVIYSFPESLLAGPDQDYKNPEEIEAFVHDIHDRFPQITEIRSIGKSSEGRDIWAIKISDNARSNELEPAVYFNGVHHAREVMTAEVTTDMIEYLTSRYGTDAEVTKWVDSYEIWVVPMYNVDGNNKVWLKSPLWRKNTREEHGTDLNRNYPRDWNACLGSSVDPWSEIYRGSGPASEPETKVIMAFVSSIKPVFSISYHSYSEVVLYPFGCGSKQTPAEDAVVTIGKEIGKKLDYVPGTPWQLLYNADGGDIDWLYVDQQVIPYVIEVNSSAAGFQPEYKKWRNKTVELNRKGWMHILNRMDGPSIQGVIRNRAYTSIKIAQAGKAPFKTYRINPNGTFNVILNPGAYDFTFEGIEDKKTLPNVTIVKKETIEF